MSIPVIDLRATDSLGEPPVLLKPTTPKQKTNYGQIVSQVAGGIVWSVYIVFLIITAILIIYLFGPLVGIPIVLMGLAKIVPKYD